MSSSVEPAAPALVSVATTAPEHARIPSTLDPLAKLKESPRTSYLPLLSPHVELDPKETLRGQTSPSYIATSPQKRRRSSAGVDLASQQASGADTLSYFDIKKQDDDVDDVVTAASDPAKKQKLDTPDQPASAPPSASNAAAAVASPSPKSAAPRNRPSVVELSGALASPLLKALESSLAAKAGDRFRQQRAYSVPRNMRSTKEPVDVGATRSSFASASTLSSSPASPQQRRDSMRAQQLSLLVSQARLASAGTTNVNAAMRAEKALKGAVWKAVESVQARKERASIAGTLVSAEEETQKEPTSRRASARESPVTPAAVAATSDPVHTWSEALATPRNATMFMDSVGEVAHDWANGFYAYEKKWVGDALQRVRANSDSDTSGAPTSPVPLSPTEKEPPAAAAADASLESTTSEPVLGRRTSLSAPPPATTSAAESASKLGSLLAGGVHHTTDTMDLTTSASPNTNAARLTLMAAQRRISVALPAKRVSIAAAVADSELGGGSGGKLLDVLSNFATLIDSRKEGCHSLEKLAHNARRLSAVQLPSSATTRSSYGAVLGAADRAGLASAMSSNASSPVSVASPRC